MANSNGDRPSLIDLAGVLVISGSSTFGGGTATIVEIERELIDRRGWLSRADSHLAFAISRLTPGTNLLAYCVAIGWRMRGATGTCVALMAVSVPSAIIAAVATRFFASWAEHPVTARALNAVLAAAVAIMLGTAWTMIQPYVEQRQHIRTFLFALSGLVLAMFGGLSPLQVLVMAALAGALWPGAARR